MVVKLCSFKQCLNKALNQKLRNTRARQTTNTGAKVFATFDAVITVSKARLGDLGDYQDQDNLNNLPACPHNHTLHSLTVLMLRSAKAGDNKATAQGHGQAFQLY